MSKYSSACRAAAPPPEWSEESTPRGCATRGATTKSRSNQTPLSAAMLPVTRVRLYPPPAARPSAAPRGTRRIPHRRGPGLQTQGNRGRRPTVRGEGRPAPPQPGRTDSGARNTTVRWAGDFHLATDTVQNGIAKHSSNSALKRGVSCTSHNPDLAADVKAAYI
eukprot:463099-Prorocentrum_minimum.AAC.1